MSLLCRADQNQNTQVSRARSSDDRPRDETLMRVKREKRGQVGQVQLTRRSSKPRDFPSALPLDISPNRVVAWSNVASNIVLRLCPCQQLVISGAVQLSSMPIFGIRRERQDVVLLVWLAWLVSFRQGQLGIRF